MIRNGVAGGRVHSPPIPDGQALSRTQAKGRSTIHRVARGQTGSRARRGTGGCDQIADALRARTWPSSPLDGWGHGTGAAPVVFAEGRQGRWILNRRGRHKALLVRRRAQDAGRGDWHKELSQHVDSVIVILNEKLEEVLGDDVSMEEAVLGGRQRGLKNAVAGISEIINVPGSSTSTFRTFGPVMASREMAMIGFCGASGVDRARSLPRGGWPAPCSKASICPAHVVFVGEHQRANKIEPEAARDQGGLMKHHPRLRCRERTIIFGAVL